MTDRTMPDARPLRAGDPTGLGGYEIVGRLGEGGQGSVFLGRPQGDADGHVAIKLLHSALTADPSARNRFVRELEVAKRVARFCTAQILDADLAGAQPYIVSEYVSGRSLHRLVTEEGPRTGGALERLAVSTLTALTAIHQAGIVHRDFKPHNVVMGPDGPRVIDFGVARALDAAGETQNVGTPAYMAPEHFNGGPIGPAADMFAWGITMVFAATGHPAFGNDEMAAVMHRILTGEPDLGGLPEPLRTVVAACLGKNPAQRPTARQAQERLVATDAYPLPPAPDQAPQPPAPAAPANPGRVASHSAPPPAITPPITPAIPPAGPAGLTMPGHSGRPQLNRWVPAVVAAAVASLLVGTGVWAAAQLGGGSGDSENGNVAAVSPGRASGVPGASGGPAVAPNGRPTPGAPTGPKPGTSGKPTKGAPSAPAGTKPRTGQPSGGTGGGDGGATGGSGDSGGGDTEPKPESNPYTPQQVCNSGGHGGGYYIQRSSSFSGGTAYQLYNSSGYNCAVTMKTRDVGKSTSVWAKLEAQGGGSGSDNGSFKYYAGPVYVYAKGVCVRYSGGTSSGSGGASWGNCG